MYFPASVFGLSTGIDRLALHSQRFWVDSTVVHIKKDPAAKCERGQVNPHHKDIEVSIGAGARGAPVSPLGDVVLLSHQSRPPVHQSNKNWRRGVIAPRAELWATDANGAMTVEPDRQIDRFKIGFAIDQIERHTHAVRFEIAVALAG